MNIDLVIKQLRIIGLPDDKISLIVIWLRNIMISVKADDLVSNLCNINHGTIQGSIFDPVLYVLPLKNLSNFADDNYVLTWHKN